MMCVVCRVQDVSIRVNNAQLFSSVRSQWDYEIFNWVMFEAERVGRERGRFGGIWLFKSEPNTKNDNYWEISFDGWFRKF